MVHVVHVRNIVKPNFCFQRLQLQVKVKGSGGFGEQAFGQTDLHPLSKGEPHFRDTCTCTCKHFFDSHSQIFKYLFHKPVHSWSPCRCDRTPLTVHVCPENQLHQHSLHSRLLATDLLHQETHTLTIKKQYHCHLLSIRTLIVYIKHYTIKYVVTVKGQRSSHFRFLGQRNSMLIGQYDLKQVAALAQHSSESNKRYMYP